MKSATRLAVCSIVTALSVVLLFLGGITFVLAYTMPMIVGLFMIMLNRTFGKSSAWITYAATSALSFILVSDKECMLMYVMLFGFYPMVHEELGKIRMKLLRITLKLLIFNVLLVAVQRFLCLYSVFRFLKKGRGNG